MTPARNFEWRKTVDAGGHVFWALLPLGTVNPWSMKRIASVYSMPGSKRFCGAYYYPRSSGARDHGWAYHKTASSARRWVGRSLAGFWEPPTIVNPT